MDCAQIMLVSEWRLQSAPCTCQLSVSMHGPCSASEPRLARDLFRSCESGESWKHRWWLPFCHCTDCSHHHCNCLVLGGFCPSFLPHAPLAAARFFLLNVTLHWVETTPLEKEPPTSRICHYAYLMGDPSLLPPASRRLSAWKRASILKTS
jgi:hypothetical protein